MRVAELIRKLQEIGYDEDTELTFSCTDGETGEYYVIPFEEITYGEELTGEPYNNDVIDIEVDVDSVEEYIKAKAESELEKQTQRVIRALGIVVYENIQKGIILQRSRISSCVERRLESKDKN